MSNNEPKKSPSLKDITPAVTDNYEKLMEQGKQVLDSIHLNQNYREDIFEVQRQRQNIPIIITSSIRQGAELQEAQEPSEDEEGEGGEGPEGLQGIQNQGQSLSKNEGNQHMQSILKKSSKIFVTCNCLKSKCTKNYCECFTQARKCSELCKCIGCQNQGEIDKRYRTNFEMQEGEKICNCKKSNCLKKYCQCYNSGVKCNSNCKCEECKNCNDQAMENEDGEEMKEQVRRERSQQEMEEINSKIQEIARIVPKEHQEYIYSFLEYWLS